MSRRLPAPLFLLATLGGCASDRSSYPSLAPRATERQGFEAPADAKVVAPAADLQLDARIAALAKQLDTIHAGFKAAASVAQGAAAKARGKAAGSDAWLDAQTALASLDDWRAQTSALSTDVGQIAIERGVALAPDYPGLTDLASRVDEQLATESGIITRLQNMLAPA
ncbi:MAG TPA: hypothetical protein VF637_10880 [Sphingomicrobium sp.]|jgi:hypothetical protein